MGCEVMKKNINNQKPERIKLGNEEFLAIENILLKKGLESQRMEAARTSFAQLSEAEWQWMHAVASTRNVSDIESYGLDVDKKELVLRKDNKVK